MIANTLNNKWLGRVLTLAAVLSAASQPSMASQRNGVDDQANCAADGGMYIDKPNGGYICCNQILCSDCDPDDVCTITCFTQECCEYFGACVFINFYYDLLLEVQPEPDAGEDPALGGVGLPGDLLLDAGDSASDPLADTAIMGDEHGQLEMESGDEPGVPIDPPGGQLDLQMMVERLRNYDADPALIAALVAASVGDAGEDHAGQAEAVGGGESDEPGAAAGQVEEQRQTPRLTPRARRGAHRSGR